MQSLDILALLECVFKFSFHFIRYLLRNSLSFTRIFNSPSLSRQIKAVKPSFMEKMLIKNQKKNLTSIICSLNSRVLAGGGMKEY